ncbi:kinase-like protein, partial [Martensiomyces pterosporus]
ILEELGIAMNVHHRNIVRTFEVIVETDHKCYVVMEPCSVDLFTLLQKHTIAKGTCVPDDVLSCYFVQLVRGVRYLHSIGVAHRDLKLDNACVTEQGVVKIVDFGCATLFRRRVQYVEMLSMGMCGSDPYMAPELFTVDHYAAAKVDIWALGIIYFAMRHMQFPWAVAHSSRDPHYMAFLTTAKKPSENSTAASLAAKDIMRRIFDQNPATRADIYDIARDPWFQSLRCCVGEERKSDDAGACGEHHVHWTPSTEEP